VRLERMQIKITLDTDDKQHLSDTLKIVQLLHNNHNKGNSRALLGKIQTLVLMMNVAKLVESGELDSSLRSQKEYLETLWEKLIKEDRIGSVPRNNEISS
jgi:hypothetical protein